jgi:hypothetical protein
MRSIRFAVLVVAVITCLSTVSGCICVSEKHAAPSSAHRGTGKLTIAVEDEPIHEYGPLSVYINARFHGHIVETTEYSLRPGTYSLRLEQKDLPPYSAIITISSEIPVLIVAPAEP